MGKSVPIRTYPASIGDELYAKSYFDTLCNEELHNIALWISERPNPRQWLRSVRYNVLNQFISVSSRFHGIVQPMLANDGHKSDFRLPTDSVDSSMPVLSRAIQTYETNIGADMDILRLLPRLTSIRLDLDLDDALNMRKIENNIRLIPLRSLLLQWGEPRPPPATLLQHCTALRELYIEQYRFLEIGVDQIGLSSSTWEVVGRTLEVLQILQYASYETLLNIG